MCSVLNTAPAAVPVRHYSHAHARGRAVRGQTGMADTKEDERGRRSRVELGRVLRGLLYVCGKHRQAGDEWETRGDKQRWRCCCTSVKETSRSRAQASIELARSLALRYQSTSHYYCHLHPCPPSLSCPSNQSLLQYQLDHPDPLSLFSPPLVSPAAAACSRRPQHLHPT